MAEPMTSGMIALLPTREDQKRLAVDGGQSPDELHLTLLYLGDDVTGWPDEAATRLAELLYAGAPSFEPFTGHLLGHAQFNPDGGVDGDQLPCAVYLIGSAPPVVELRRWLLGVLTRGDTYETPPPQHDPFVPHVTAGFELPVSMLHETGMVAFDRLRLALGGHVTDIDLGADVLHDLPEVGPDGEIELKWFPRGETKVMSADPRAAKLRNYWAYGAGRKKWRPGTGGDFKRLRRHLAKFITNPKVLNGLTANIHKLATGSWPGRGRNHKSWDVELEVKTLGPADEHEVGLADGVDDWGAGFADEDTEGYDLTDDEDDVEEKALPNGKAGGAKAPAVVPDPSDGPSPDATAAVVDKLGSALEQFRKLGDQLDEQLAPEVGNEAADMDRTLDDLGRELERMREIAEQLRTQATAAPEEPSDDWDDVLAADVSFRPEPGGDLTPVGSDALPGGRPGRVAGPLASPVHT